MPSLREILATHPDTGRVTWIGARIARKGEVLSLEKTEIKDNGLVDDHRANPGRRAVTLIQAEHLPVIAALVGRDIVTPTELRRNIVVSGINLTAVRHHPIRIGSAVLQIEVPCAPCSRMEEVLGPGGYNAMRGHGGWTASVVAEGEVALGDKVEIAQEYRNSDLSIGELLK